MRTSEEMQRFLQALMGWGLERPSMYGGTPQGADGVFWYWRYIWAQLTERVNDFYNAIGAAMDSCWPPDEDDEVVPRPAIYPHGGAEPTAYSEVISFWKDVDRRLGIDYPSGTEFIHGGEPSPATH